MKDCISKSDLSEKELIENLEEFAGYFGLFIHPRLAFDVLHPKSIASIGQEPGILAWDSLFFQFSNKVYEIICIMRRLVLSLAQFVLLILPPVASPHEQFGANRTLRDELNVTLS
jgi:hypothetical protein